jgi:hypothetical protein
MERQAQRTDPPYANNAELLETIDSVAHGDLPWKSFAVTYDGEIGDVDVTPEWKTKEFEVYYRDPLDVLRQQLGNPEYAETKQMDYAPKQLVNEKSERVFSDYMSGNHPWRKAVSLKALLSSPRRGRAGRPELRRSPPPFVIQTALAESVATAAGGVYCPLICGSDKTTVSVATGQTEFYPLYLSNGLVHNTVRRAHRGAVSLIAFLAIPKSKYELVIFLVHLI